MSSFPKWPSDVKKAYSIVFDKNSGPHCFEYDILSTSPFLVSEPLETDLVNCDGLFGQRGVEMKKVVNMSDQIGPWVRKNCKGL